MLLKYGPDRSAVITGIKRVSKPGLRRYVNVRDIPSVLGGLGIAILSTSTRRDDRQRGAHGQRRRRADLHGLLARSPGCAAARLARSGQTARGNHESHWKAADQARRQGEGDHRRGQQVNFDGPKGKLSVNVPEQIKVEIKDGEINVAARGRVPPGEEPARPHPHHPRQRREGRRAPGSSASWTSAASASAPRSRASRFTSRSASATRSCSTLPEGVTAEMDKAQPHRGRSAHAGPHPALRGQGSPGHHRREDPRAAPARAVQGQGRQVLGRARPPQGRQDRYRLVVLNIQPGRCARGAPALIRRWKARSPPDGKGSSHGHGRSAHQEEEPHPPEALGHHRASAAHRLQEPQAHLRAGGGRLHRQDAGLRLHPVQGAQGPGRGRQEGRREARGHADRAEVQGGQRGRRSCSTAMASRITGASPPWPTPRARPG